MPKNLLHTLLIVCLSAILYACAGENKEPLPGDNQEPWLSFGFEGEGMIVHPAHFYANDRFLFVSDQLESTVRAYSYDGQFYRNFGREGRGPGELHQQYKVVADSKRLYVDDESNRRIVMYDLHSGESAEHKIDFTFYGFQYYSGKFYTYSTYGAFMEKTSSVKGNLITVYNREFEKIRSFGTYLERAKDMPLGINWPHYDIENNIVHVAFQYFPVYRAYDLEGNLILELDLSEHLEIISDPGHNYDKNRRSPEVAIFRALDVYENRVFIHRQGRKVLIDEYRFNDDTLRYQNTFTYSDVDEGFFVIDFVYHEPENSFYALVMSERVPMITAYKLSEEE